jgi:hypothetical protein
MESHPSSAEVLTGLLAFSGVSHLLEFDKIFMTFFYAVSSIYVLVQLYYKIKFKGK